MKKIAIIITLIWSLTMCAQTNPYKIVDKDLKPVDFSSVAKKAAGAEVVFFGETHNSVVAHDWMCNKIGTISYNIFTIKSNRVFIFGLYDNVIKIK